MVKKLEIELYEDEIDMLNEFLVYKKNDSNCDWTPEYAIKILFMQRLEDRIKGFKSIK